jgi:diguanylate cyclase (GGDEF)-like protein/PAS domain S-box-containing protein
VIHPIQQLRRALALGLLLFVAAMVGITGYTLWMLRADAIANGLAISETHTRNFESFVSQNLRGAETAMVQAVRLQDGMLSVAATEAAFAEALRQAPFLRSLSIVDAHDRVIASSNPANRGLTLALDNFLPNTPHVTEVVRVGTPWLGRDFANALPLSAQTPGDPVMQSFIPLQKTVEVNGTVVRLLAALNIDFYLNYALRTLDPAEGRLQVLRYDGVLLVDTDPAATLGSVQPWVTRELRLDAVEVGSQVRRDAAGQAELIAYRASSLYPLVLVAHRPQAVVLQQWRSEAKALLAVVIPSMLGIALLVVEFLRRQTQFLVQRQEAERLQRVSATVFAESAEAIIITDPDTRIISVNPAFTLITGYSAEEVLGKTPKLLQSGLHDKPFYEALWKELLTKGVWHGEVVNRKKDGSLYDARLSITASRDKAGNLQHFIGDIWDITERTRAQVALIESRNLLASIIDTAPIRVFWKDRELRYLGCNQAFARDAGMREPKDLIGKDDTLMVWAAQAQQYRADDLEVMQTGVSRLSYDEPQTTPDGRTLWLRTSKVPLKNHEQETIGILGIYEDISDYKRAQKALATSEERFRRAFYLTPDSLVISRMADGIFVSANHGFTHMFGYTAEEAIGRSSLELGLWNDPEDRRRLVKGLQESGTVTSMEAVFRTKNGGTTQGLMSASTIDLDGVPHILNITHDITERKRAEENLSLAASVFANSREGIMITALNGTIIDVNDAFTRITGYTRDDVLGGNPRLLRSGRQGKDFYAAMWKGLLENGHWYGEIWNRRKNGEVFAEMQTISTVRDSKGMALHFVSLFSDISVYKEHQHQLEHIAHYDALTGLPNRVLLADRMRQGIAQVQRRKQLMALAFLDLDGFKSINDLHGHEAGDQLLITLATRMKQTLREGDTLARLGGDEFVVVLLDLPDVASSAGMLARLLEAAAQPFVWGDTLLQVSASVGVTFYPQVDSVDADQMLRQADQAMYQAKLAGKNRYHIFDAEQDRSVRGHHEDLAHIHQGFQAREFELHYQPKVNMRSGEVIGVEGLIRWRHPRRGLLAPGQFLPAIEDQPIAVEIGEWVIDTALAQLRQWQAGGLRLPISVNIGARQLQQADFVSRLRAMLARYPDVAPTDLELEVLETSALEDLSHVSQVINDCHQLGVHFALDDFGTGYSSLTYLKLLPVAQLKIDQSFVRDMLVDPDDLAILEGIIGLANAFRREVIAEGVESVQTGQMLLQMGCERAQGFGIARPMPAADIAHWVANWRTAPAWLNQAAIGREDFPLLSATVEHRAWVIALEQFLRGERDAPPPLHVEHCRMGIWLKGGGLEAYGKLPAVQAAQHLHQSVHALATQILAWHQQGDTDSVSQGLTQLHALRDDLLVQLQLLLNR